MSAQEDDELIARLRKRAAWQRENRGDMLDYGTPDPELEQAAARLTAMREEIERKDEVLRPFAHYCELNDLLDNGDPERAIEVPVSDLQRAYAALIKE